MNTFINYNNNLSKVLEQDIFKENLNLMEPYHYKNLDNNNKEIIEDYISKI